MHAASGEDVSEGAWIMGVFSGAAIVLIVVVGISWWMCTDAWAVWDFISAVSLFFTTPGWRYVSWQIYLPPTSLSLLM